MSRELNLCQKGLVWDLLQKEVIVRKSCLITHLGPALVTHDIERHQLSHRSVIFLKLATGILLLGTLVWMGLESAHAEATNSDPLVMKVYPDGTKVVVRWSEIGKQFDNGEKFGGAPRIVAYDPAKDGIVPIGNPASASNSIPSPTAPNPGTTLRIDQNTAQTLSEPEAGFAQLGFYVSPQLGVSIVEDVNLNNSLTLNGGDVYVSLNNGVRFDLAMGGRVNEWLSIEFTPGLIYNQIVSGYNQNIALTVQGDYWQVPLLANFIFTIPTQSMWEPFLGGGIGGLYANASITGLAGQGVPNTSGSSWAVGYSGLAGLNCNFTKDISVGVVYKFTGTTEQNWSGGLDGLATNTYTHSVLFSGTFRF